MTTRPLMEPKRFLYIIARGDSFGGSSMHVRDLSARLPRDGHEVKILIGGTPDMEVPDRLREMDVEFDCIESMGREIDPFRDLKAIWQIRKAAKEFNPDLISTHASKGGALGRIACLGMKAPILYTPHCWAFVDGFSLAFVYRWVEKMLALGTDHIITVSDDERDFALNRGVGRPDKMKTIHNGVMDLPIVKTEKSTSTIDIVMVGRFENQKDQATLLRALLGLRLNPDWHLTFVGNGPTLRDNIDLCKRLGLKKRVTFSGYSSEVSQLLSNSDIFILASNWEGFPRSILEAMRSGVPVIASDVGGCRESVIDGVNGFIVPKGDKKKLRSAIRQLIENPVKRKEMGEAGRRLYENEFTFEIMYQNYCRLYERLLLSPEEREVSASQNEPLSMLERAG